MKYTLILFLIVFAFFTGKIEPGQNQRPVVAFSFDDGNPNDILNYTGEAWNAAILAQLRQNNIQAVWFVSAKNLNNDKGKLLLKHWDDAGNLIANHTFSHINFNDPETSIEKFENEILKCDSFIKGYTNYRKYFRFPYLKAGDTFAKKDSILSFLKKNDYKQGWVTIDNSDWYINSRLIKRLKENPNADIKVYEEFYLNHIIDRARYYNELSKEINHREIKHTVLLHFNLSSALFLNALIDKFRNEGWEIQNYSNVIQDTVYNFYPSAIPSEQSLIWMQAKQAGNFESRLRYPGEDGEFEKDKMDKAGL